MEWTEGYNLNETVDQENIFSIREIITIAEQISRALASCHTLGLIHGNINKSNILWDSKKKTYVLTGFRFGLDGSNKNSKTTGSIAVISPERKVEEFSQQRDVLCLGLVLLQLLSGRSEMANSINIQEQRMQMLPVGWSLDKKNEESNIPSWLRNFLAKATRIDNDGFSDAREMYQYILVHNKTPLQRKKWYRSKPQQYVPSAPLKKQWRPVGNLAAMMPSLKLVVPPYIRKKSEEMRFVFDRNIAVGLVIAALLTGFSIYAQKREHEREKPVAQMKKQTQKPVGESRDEQNATFASQPVTANAETTITEKASKAVKPETALATPKKDTRVATIKNEPVPKDVTPGSSNSELGAYKVRSKAFFHNSPDETTRRKAFIVHWNNAILRPLKEEKDFIYIVFTNHLGQTSKGWLRKKDLIKQ